MPLALFLPAGLGLVFLVLPLVGLLARTPWTSLPQRLSQPGVLTALRLSLQTATLATLLCLALCVPLAWLLAREAFVAMPFLVIAVEGALRAADPRYEEAAATLGAGRWTTFTHVTLPLVAPGIAAGAVLCWARALGEFGATITFAGNYPGRTQTMPLAVYLALETDVQAAIVLSLVLLTVSVAILAGLRDRWVGAP